jgi:hypothetical protein
VFFSTKTWIRCVLAIWLFFFAATADFVSTSVITARYNANNPPVRIEHKCAGHWGRVTHQPESAAPVELISASAKPIATIQPSLPVAISDLPAVSNLSSSSSSPPLRC